MTHTQSRMTKFSLKPRSHCPQSTVCLQCNLTLRDQTDASRHENPPVDTQTGPAAPAMFFRRAYADLRSCWARLCHTCSAPIFFRAVGSPRVSCQALQTLMGFSAHRIIGSTITGIAPQVRPITKDAKVFPLSPK